MADSKRKEKGIYEQAQQILVGSVLVKNDSLDEIISIVSSDDFTDPALSVIFDSIADLTRKDKTVSAVSVAADLESKGMLAQVGGHAILEDLRYNGEDWVTQIPPRTAAALVKDGSVKYNVSNILQESKDSFKSDSGISARDGIEAIQNHLNDQLLSISDETTITKVSESFKDYIDLVEQRKLVYEQNKDLNGGLQGIPSNIESLNKYTTGWLPGQLITCAARTSVGKALALDTPIPTPFGWTTMGELEVGDQVIGRDGYPTNVVNITDVQYNRECFKVKIADETIIADSNHQWLVIDDTGIESIKTTKELSVEEHYIVPAKYTALTMKSLNSVSKELISIDSITATDSVPVKCIQVDNDDHMYLAGHQMIPTHNSVFAVNSAVAAARANKSVMFFSLEMKADEIQDRIFSSISSVPLQELKQGTLSPESEEWFKEGVDEFKTLKITLDIDPQVTIDNIRAKASKQAQSEEGLDLIIVDYLQLVSPPSGKKYNTRQEEVRDLSRGMKLLAKNLDVPIIVLAQVNKAKDDDEDDTPRMDQIRESYTIAQDSDIVILLHRNTRSEDPDPKTYMILEKNRNGENNKVIVCRSDLACSKFEEIKRYSGDDSLDPDYNDFQMSDDEYHAGVEEANEMFDDFEMQTPLDFSSEPTDGYTNDGLDNLNYD